MVELATEYFTKFNFGQTKTEDAGHGWQGDDRSFLNDMNRYAFLCFHVNIVVFIFFVYIKFVVLHDLYSIKTTTDRYLIYLVELISIFHDCSYSNTHELRCYFYNNSENQKKYLHILFIFLYRFQNNNYISYNSNFSYDG